jgi:hypothetical protein
MATKRSVTRRRVDRSIEDRRFNLGDVTQKQINRIANAVYSNFLTERADDVFFIRSLDFLLIALEAPFAIQATSSDERRTFDTCNTAGMVRSKRPVVFPVGVELRILSDCRGDERRCHALLDKASHLLDLISKTLEWYAEDRADELGRRMNQAINALAKKGEIRQRHDVARDDWDENAKLLDRFFERLELEVQSASDLCFFPSQIVGSGRRCSRLYFFHRHAPDDNFSMRLHPLANQRNSTASGHLDKAVEGIWRFDDVVGKGLVSWIQWASDDPKNRASAGIQAFRQYLAELMAQPNNQIIGGVNRGDTYKGLAIPMHVGGVVWLVVLFVFAEEEKNYGDLAYYIIRAIVPTLFDNIAGIARDEYLSLIGELTKECFTGARRFDTSSLNTKISRIASTVPYGEWYLSADKNDFPITAFKETHYLHAKTVPQENDFVVDFRTIRPADVRDKIQHIALEVETEIQREKDLQQGADEGIGHSLKNIVDLTNWPIALASTRSTIRNYYRLSADEILRRLQVANQCISLFSLVAGLGHSARLAGALDREDYEKFIDWLDERELRRWTSGRKEDQLYICDAYAEAVYRIAISLCALRELNREPQRFEVVCTGASQAWARREYHGLDLDEFEEFDKSKLHVHPFKIGSDAAYSFVFALTEPLVNALRALDQLRTNSQFSASDRVLKICIKPDFTAKEIEFSIHNPSSTIVQGTLSGFERTRHMLRRIGLAEIDDLRFTAIRPSVYEATASVHFKPYNLAKKIQDARGDIERQGGTNGSETQIVAN